MASSLYTAGSALGFVCPRYADVPIDTMHFYCFQLDFACSLFKRKSYNNGGQRNGYGPA